MFAFYWGSRHSGAKANSKLVAQLLTRLSTIDKHLSQWSLWGASRSKGKDILITGDTGQIQRLLPKRTTRSESGRTILHDLGFHMMLLNEVPCKGNVGLSLTFDSMVHGVSNLCNLSVEPGTSAQAALSTPDSLTAICNAIVDTWEPENGAVTCRSLIDEVHPEAMGLDAGWLIYRTGLESQVSNKLSKHFRTWPNKLGNGLFSVATDKISMPPTPAEIEAVRRMFSIIGPEL